jgi:chemotaxis protein CheD
MINPPKFYLLPGAIKCSKSPLEITTILGSCVSVCLWDSKLKMGGMNHFMMPFWNGDGLASPKYGNIAIEKLIFNLLYLGSERENLVAKVFGGAAVLNSCDGIFNIGERNIQIQEELLRQESIKVVAGSLGGTVGRKLIFETGTGLVKMKYISKTQTP